MQTESLIFKLNLIRMTPQVYPFPRAVTQSTTKFWGAFVVLHRTMDIYLPAVLEAEVQDGCAGEATHSLEALGENPSLSFLASGACQQSLFLVCRCTFIICASVFTWVFPVCLCVCGQTPLS